MHSSWKFLLLGAVLLVVAQTVIGPHYLDWKDCVDLDFGYLVLYCLLVAVKRA